MIPAVVAVLVWVGGAFRWARRPTLLATGAATAAGVSIVDTFAGNGPPATVWIVVTTPFLLLVLAQVARRPAPRLAVPVGTLVFCAIALSPLRIGLWLTPPAPTVEIVAVCATWALLAAMAVGVGSYLRWMDRTRERSVAATRREQRLRLAADLHDWFAHEMTGIVLEAQAGRLGVHDPAEAAGSFRHIEEAGLRGLAAMDRALDLLRTGDPAGSPVTMAEVADVARRFAERAPGRVTIEIEPGLDDLRPEVVATVHRVVLESLTNVRRHVPAAGSVTVEVAREGATLVVSVTDDGGRRESRLTRRFRSGGTGLAELRERVEALGGGLRAGRAGRGWAVRVELPVSP